MSGNDDNNVPKQAMEAAERSYQQFKNIPNEIAAATSSGTQSQGQQQSPSAPASKAPLVRTFLNQGPADTDLAPPGDNSTDDDKAPTTHELTERIMQPIKKTFSRLKVLPDPQQDIVVVKLPDIHKAIYGIHFILKDDIHRLVLRDDSKVKKYGRQAGLPEGLWRWLCGEGVVYKNNDTHREYRITREDCFRKA